MKAQLQYAPRPALLWLLRWRKPIITIAIVFAVGSSVYRYGPPLMLRARWLYWSHECAIYQMPAPIPLVVNDPQRAGQLVASGTGYVRQVFNGGVTPTPVPGAVAIFVPTPWRRLQDVDGRSGYIGDDFATEPIAFFGSLRRPDGVSRLVVIKGGDGVNACCILGGLKVLVLAHPSLLGPLPREASGPGHSYFGRAEPATLSMARRDPTDPSHLTFTLQMISYNTGKPFDAGSLDAYLRNDDSLTFQLHATTEAAGRGAKLGNRTSVSGVVPPDRFVSSSP